MKRAAFAFCVLLGGLIGCAHAQQLLISAIEQADHDSLATPPRGATMSKVKQRFGMPARILPAVGKPPITRWIYPQFIVYFEHRWVIDTVESHPADSENPSAK